MKKSLTAAIMGIALSASLLVSCDTPAMKPATANPRLAVAQNLAIEVGTLQLKITWDAVPDATGYSVYYTTDGTEPTTDSSFESVTANSFTHLTLTDKLVYTYKVAATASGYDSSITASQAARPNNALLFIIIDRTYAHSPILVLPLYANSPVDWSTRAYAIGAPVSKTTDSNGFATITLPIDRTHYWGYTVIKDLDASNSLSTGDEVWGSSPGIGSFDYLKYDSLTPTTYILTFSPWNSRSSSGGTSSTSHIY